MKKQLISLLTPAVQSLVKVKPLRWVLLPLFLVAYACHWVSLGREVYSDFLKEWAWFLKVPNSELSFQNARSK